MNQSFKTDAFRNVTTDFFINNAIKHYKMCNTFKKMHFDRTYGMVSFILMQCKDLTMDRWNIS